MKVSGTEKHVNEIITEEELSALIHVHLKLKGEHEEWFFDMLELMTIKDHLWTERRRCDDPKIKKKIKKQIHEDIKKLRKEFNDKLKELMI